MQNYLLPVFLLIKRLSIVLLGFVICRLLFYVFNISNFPDASPMIFVYGLRFDVSAIGYYFLPFVVLHILPFQFTKYSFYQTILKIYFHVINSLVLLFNCIDIIYFRFTLNRTTSDIFEFIFFSNDVLTLTPRFLVDFWYIPLIWISLIAMSVFLYNKIRIDKLSTQKNNFIIQLIIAILIFGLAVIGGRGGLQLKPIDVIKAGKYVESEYIPLVLNTPFTIIKSFDKQSIKQKDYFKETEINKYYSPVIEQRDTNTFTPLNIVVIIMESFSKEYMGFFNNGKGYTPFVDSLARYSLVFNNAFANGKRSIESLPAIISSLPTLMNNPYSTSAYSGNKIYSIANVLKSKGYSSSFYHGGKNGTMGFDDFTKMAGIDSYYGMNEYPNKNDYDGNWGIFDEEYFQYVAKQLNKTSSPFFACIYSLSSHHPFTIPEKYKGKFNKQRYPILESIEYSDYSLRKFFSTVSKASWFDNTLFVITADHTGIPIVPYYRSKIGMYSVPIIYYKHNSDLKGINNTITQQTDIMPSVLDYLNYSGNYIAFGSSVFSDNSNHFSVTYLDDIYQLIDSNYVLQFNGEESIALFDHKKDILLRRNLISKEKEHLKDMENKLKAIIQNYNNRLINNSLVLKKE